MGNIVKVLILVLSCQFCFGQILTRKTLHGRVVNDSIAVENGLVFNISSKSGDIIDNKGRFSILAKATDTLLVTSLGFKSQKVILSSSDINSSFYKIKLQAVANELLTVLVYAKNVPHSQFGNTQSIVDTQYFDDKQSSPDNILMIPTGTGNPNSMDCIRVYNKIFKNLFKSNPSKTDFVSDVSFTNVAMHSVNYSFFTDILKIHDDQIGLFLLYCENDPKSKSLIDSNKQFEIIEFLVTKYDSFKQIASLEK